MSSRTFDRETLLDLIVNAIPLGIMAFFILLFALVNPFGTDLANQAIQFSLVIITFGALLVLTYYSARAISNAEAELEADPEEFAEPEGAAGAPSEETTPDYDDEAFGEVTADEPAEDAAAMAADEIVEDDDE